MFEIPEGYELDTDKFIEAFCRKKSKLPTDYDDLVPSFLCSNVPVDINAAEAFLALSRLYDLKQAYNDGWVPDYEDDHYKYAIKFACNQACEDIVVGESKFLAFPTEELRDHFLEHHRELIEQAKPLL